MNLEFGRLICFVQPGLVLNGILDLCLQPGLLERGNQKKKKVWKYYKAHATWEWYNTGTRERVSM